MRPDDFMPPTPFAEAIKVNPLGNGSYAATVYTHPDFSVAEAAHGGFLISLCLSAVGTHFATTLASYNQLYTWGLHVEFLRPGHTGDAVIEVHDSRLGKGSSTVHVSLKQNGKEKAVGYVTQISSSRTESVTLNLDNSGYRLPSPKPIDFGLLEEHKDPNWIIFRLPWFPDATNKAGTNVKFALERQPSSPKDTVAYYLGSANPSERWTTFSIGILIDQVVPPLENFFADSPHNVCACAAQAVRWVEEDSSAPSRRERYVWSSPRWYTTTAVSLEIKKSLPKDGIPWVFVRYTTRSVQGGKMDVHCEVYDEKMELVAISQQLWMLIVFDKTSHASLARRNLSQMKEKLKVIKL